MTGFAALVVFGFAAFFATAEIEVSESSVYGQPMKQRMPWYHSADEIHDELQDLSRSCKDVEFEMSTRSKPNAGASAGQEITLDVIHIKRSSASQDRMQTKAVFVYGEHAREIITGESALDFAHTLCGRGPNAQRAQKMLDSGVEFILVPNANPSGRQEVEKGYWCKRTNEDDVDINRNWGDDHRNPKQEQSGNEQNPGPRGFSEPETQMLRDLVTEERPDIFLSVHSGAYLLGAPYGYNANKVPSNLDGMMEVLKPVSEKYCNGQCPYGGLAELIGYDSDGCDIDWVADQLNVPYAFTWEIFTGEDRRDKYIKEANDNRGADTGADAVAAMSLAQHGRHTKRQRGGKLRGSLEASIEDSWIREEHEDADGCIDEFNPKSMDETKAVAENWSGAYLELCEQVVLQKGGSGSATNATAASTMSAAASPTVNPYSKYFSDSSTPTTASVETPAVATNATSATDMALNAMSVAELNAKQAAIASPFVFEQH